jgi:hypothetical protein
MRSLDIDIRFDGGAVRIKKASGVTDRATRNSMAEMLRLLWKQPQHRHLIIDVARPNSKRTIFDLYTAYLAGKLGDLTPSFEDHELETLKDEWLGEFQASQSHKNTLRGCFKRLVAGLKYKPKVSDLPALLEAYRTKCLGKGTPREFNYTKMGCLALLRDKLGKRHPLRNAVADIVGMPEAKRGVLGMGAEDARAKRRLLLEAGETEAAGIWWSMVCTGMGPTELWGDALEDPMKAWKELADRILINGTKRPGRCWGSEGREVPNLTAITRPTMTKDHFGKVLKRVAAAAPRQARKTFACMMEDAEIPRTRRRMYLGHGAKDVTDRYERREITAFLAEDRARLLKQLGPDTALEISRTAGLVIQSMAREA